jgi:hypothetical protein
VAKARLNPFQRKALTKLAPLNGDIQWRDAYSLKQSLATMRSLEKKGYVESRHGLGSMAFPRSSIEWRITQAGRDLLNFTFDSSELPEATNG